MLGRVGRAGSMSLLTSATTIKGSPNRARRGLCLESGGHAE
jgi:hypothetical protein